MDRLGASLIVLGLLGALAIYLVICIIRVRRQIASDKEAEMNATPPILPLPVGICEQMGKAIGGVATAMAGLDSSTTDLTASFEALGVAMKRFKVSTKWELAYIKLNWHDIWVGLYWSVDTYDGFDNYPDEGELDRLCLYICLLPCVVIRVDRIREFVYVPQADPAIDPTCKVCGLLLSQHTPELGCTFNNTSDVADLDKRSIW